jgi:hypothetical protein
MDLLRGCSRRVLQFALILSIVSAVFLAVGPSDSQALQYTLTPLSLGADTYNGIGNTINGNTSPQIVGSLSFDAFYYDGLASTTYNPGIIAESFGVNGNGIYVGTAFNFDGYKKPFVSTGYLPDPIGYELYDTEGRGINDAGVVVGYGLEFGGSGLFTAFKWDASGNGSVITGLGGASTQAFGINNNGYIVGAVDGVGFVLNGALTTFTDLSAAYGINNAGTIVGQGSGGSFVCNGTTCELIASPGWSNLQVTGINDDGTIIGLGMAPTGAQAYFTGKIFTQPVPEPGILSLLVAGVALIPVVRKRIGL